MAQDRIDIVGDEIWLGSHRVGCITLPVGTLRDHVEDVLCVAHDREVSALREQITELGAIVLNQDRNTQKA
jgi:hypothetical protein